MNYTKQEKIFLERIGITPGPWELYIDKLSIVVMDEKRIDQFIATVPKKTNAMLIAHSPDMFLSLFRVALDCSDSALLHCSYFANISKRCEQATGKSWKELFEIWEACE